MYAKIANTGSEDDDYYVKFEPEEFGVDGAGAWVECVKPGIYTVLNGGTMPHQLVRQSNGEFFVMPP